MFGEWIIPTFDIDYVKTEFDQEQVDTDIQIAVKVLSTELKIGKDEI